MAPPPSAQSPRKVAVSAGTACLAFTRFLGPCGYNRPWDQGRIRETASLPNTITMAIREGKEHHGSGIFVHITCRAGHAVASIHVPMSMIPLIILPQDGVATA